MIFLQKKWPFAVNALLLSLMVLLGLYIFNDTLGFSGVFMAASGYAEEAVNSQDFPQLQWDWQLGMLLGIFVGGVCGSLIHRSWKIVFAWEECKGFSGTVFKTPLMGLLSGFLVMFGSIISGEAFYGQFAAAMELSAGAWFFLVAALTSGGITALFIERSREKHSGSGKGGEE